MPPSPAAGQIPTGALPVEPSLEDVVRVLCAARRFFGVAGTAFLLWKLDEVLRKNPKGALGGALMEVALVSVLGPGLVWVTSQWGERLAKEASRHHDELLGVHARAQQEIAERKRAESALGEANARLEARVGERTRELTALNEALRCEMSERQRAERALVEQEKLAATGRMAAQMAHEINNPLAGIKNAYRVIRDAIPPEHPDGRFVGLIDKEIDRIARIVHQTLDLYRPHTEPPRRLRVDRAVQEVALLLEAPCRARGVELALELPAPPPEAWLPEGPVRQVLFNLLENALEASPRGGRVTVTVTVSDEALRLAVADQGPGIPGALRARVFEPFFTTKDRGGSGGGVGLGLSVSRSLVQAMSGELTFECDQGPGTRFDVLLPLLVRDGVAVR
jgi:signal transduction histidine kinase